MSLFLRFSMQGNYIGLESFASVVPETLKAPDRRKQRTEPLKEVPDLLPTVRHFLIGRIVGSYRKRDFKTFARRQTFL